MITNKKAINQKQQLLRLVNIARYYQHSKQNGFTIIESLMAIVVVSILLMAIAPVLALSVANRVQARRVELASQAARSYIDAVRTQQISAPTLGTTSVTASPAPTPSGSLNCLANSYCTSSGTTSTTPTSLYCIDGDGDGVCKNNSPRDMIIQATGYSPSVSATTKAYTLGIRIYRADAFSETTALIANDPNQPDKKVTQLASGFVNRKAPLVQMTTEINDIVPNYKDLCTRTNGSPTTTANCMQN